MSERVMYNYLSDPTFDTRYKTARDDIVRGVSNHLREHMSEAVDIIGNIMRNPDNRPQDRLAAAKAVLEYGKKYIESGDILERIGNLERRSNDEQTD